MTKAEFIEKIAAENGLTKKSASELVNAVLKGLTDVIGAGDKVFFSGFGTFEVRERAARKGKNPRTKEIVEIPGCKVPVFKAGKYLKDAANK